MNVRLTAPMDNIVREFERKVDDCIERMLEVERQMEEMRDRMSVVEEKFFLLIKEDL